MPVSNGIKVFEILENGSLLNGIYTNRGLLHKNVYAVDSEIARKIYATGDGIVGLYKSRMLETAPEANNIVTACIIEIIKRDDMVYELEWRETTSTASKKLYKGLGFMVGNDRIAVSYEEIIPA